MKYKRDIKNKMENETKYTAYKQLSAIARIIIVFLLILSSCTNDTEKKLKNNLIVTYCFTPEEIKDLAKLLDFFNEQICFSEGIDKKETIKCYDSFINRMIETVKAGSLEVKIPFSKQQEVYNQISDCFFNQIWVFSKSRIKWGSPDTFKHIDYRRDGKYMEFLKELGKEYEMVKNYRDDFGIAGGISPSMSRDILMIKEDYQYDLNDVRLQLIIAIHYLTMNDKFERKEKY